MKWNIPFMAISFLSLLFATSCSLKDLVIKKNKKGYAKAPYDAIIVPGYPFEAPNHRELFNIRIHWAKTLYERGLAKNIIFSGGAIHTPYVEGKIMKLYAQSLGIDPAHIFEENEAVHSYQNLLKGKRLAKRLGFKKVAVATDPFQFAYMTLLVGIYSPGMSMLTFTPDSMPYFYQPLPEIDKRAAFIENWSEKSKN